MTKGPDETTDKLFPPPEERHGAPVLPLPLTRSIREEFLAHRLHVDKQLTLWRKELAAGLVRMEALAGKAPAPSVLDRAKAGVFASFRYGGVALALGELAAQAAHAAGHPEVEGPLRTILAVLQGTAG